MRPAAPVDDSPARYHTVNRVLLLTGFSVSTTGDWLYRLALPILVLQLTGSAVSTAVTYAIEYVPYIIFSMFAGVVADRFDRRRTLVLADIGSALIMLALTVAVAVFEVRSVPLIYLGAFALAAVRPLYHPTFQGFIPSIARVHQLSRVNAQVQSIDSLLACAGPVLGAAIIAVLDSQAALWINAASFAVSAAAMYLIRLPASGGAGQALRLVEGLRDGLRYLVRDRAILSGSVLMAGTNIGLYLIQANLIYILTAALDFPQVSIGIVFGANGLGAIAGAACAPALGRRFGAGRILVAAMALAGVATTLLALPVGLLGFVLGWGLVGVATNVIIVTWFTLRQKIVPSELLGRVVALSRMLAYLTIPLASVAGGAVLASRSMGVGTLIGISVAVQLTVSLLAWVSPLSRVDGRRAAGRGAEGDGGPAPGPSGQAGPEPGVPELVRDDDRGVESRT